METPLLKRINIVILGEEGSGKSTIGNKILQTNGTFKEAFGVTNKKADTLCDCYNNEVKINSTENHSVTIIEANTVEALKGHFENPDKCCCRKLTEIHLILYIVRSGRHSERFYDSMRKEINQLSNAGREILAMVITFCESMEEDARANAVKDYESFWNDNFSHRRLDILPVGFPSIEKSPQTFLDNYRNIIAEDRERLLQLIGKQKGSGAYCQKNKLFKSPCRRLFEYCFEGCCHIL